MLKSKYQIPLRTEKGERIQAGRLLIFLKGLYQRAVMIDFFLCGFYNKYKKEQCSVLKNNKWAEAAEAAAVT